MAKSDVITLVDTLSNGVTDTSQVTEYYEDVVEEWGRGVFPGPSLVNAEFVAVTEGISQYAMPTTAVRILALIYDDLVLTEDSSRSAEVFDPEWRTSLERPVAYVRSDEDEKTVALVPVPDVTGQTVGASTPFTGAFPAENLTIIYTENRADVHLDEELAVTLEVLARELGRDSNHHDQQAADLARRLARLLFGLANRS